jgi:hypothetical protein
MKKKDGKRPEIDDVEIDDGRGHKQRDLER